NSRQQPAKSKGAGGGTAQSNTTSTQPPPPRKKVVTPNLLRKWNSKRHICPRQRCRVKSDQLVSIPLAIRTEIESVSKAEHEIHFLLDEIVRSSSENDELVKKSVVK